MSAFQRQTTGSSVETILWCSRDQVDMRSLRSVTIGQFAWRATSFNSHRHGLPHRSFGISATGILKSEFPDVDIPQDVSVPSFIWDKNVKERPNKIAMVS